MKQFLSAHAAPLAATLLLAGCAAFAPPPLDPQVAESSLPLSASMQAYHVQQYTLTLEVLPESKSLRGSGATQLRALAPLAAVELRLDSRFDISAVQADGQPATYTRQGGLLSIALPKPLPAGGEATVTIFYQGAPHVAKRAPWDGGIVWASTPQGQPWIATAVQGVTDTLVQISTAVEEQASTADEVSSNIQQVDQAAGRLLEGARAVNRAADTLSQGSQALSGNTARFRLG